MFTHIETILPQKLFELTQRFRVATKNLELPKLNVIKNLRAKFIIGCQNRNKNYNILVFRKQCLYIYFKSLAKPKHYALRK